LQGFGYVYAGHGAGRLDQDIRVLAGLPCRDQKLVNPAAKL